MYSNIKSMFFFFMCIMSMHQTAHTMGITPPLYINKSQVTFGLAAATIGYITYFHSTEKWNAQKLFRGGIGSSLILGTIMALIECGTQAYLNTNIFSTSIPHQILKIVGAVCAAAGFSFVCGAYKDISNNNTLRAAYIKGLLCGGLLLLPFCSDL